jgi:hypothetical protein
VLLLLRRVACVLARFQRARLCLHCPLPALPSRLPSPRPLRFACRSVSKCLLSPFPSLPLVLRAVPVPSTGSSTH